MWIGIICLFLFIIIPVIVSIKNRSSWELNKTQFRLYLKEYPINPVENEFKSVPINVVASDMMGVDYINNSSAYGTALTAQYLSYDSLHAAEEAARLNARENMFALVVVLKNTERGRSVRTSYQVMSYAWLGWLTTLSNSTDI